MEEAMAVAAEIGRFPLIIRPAFTCGGTGGGIAYNVDEYKQIVKEGLDASMTNQVCVFVTSRHTQCLSIDVNE
jgi:carbamoyl-phosphate synthase large subunit